MKESGSFLANDKFNGQCPTVMSGDHKKLFRRPFNIQSYRFQVSASTSFKVDSYNSVESFFQAERKTVKKSFSFGGLLLGILTFGLSGSSSETMNRVLQWSTNSDTKIFKIYSEIHLANFAMKRPHSFITSHNFQVYVRDLPRTYDYAKYEAVIRRFGTHYYSSGYLGGRYEYIYRFSKSALRQSRLTDHEQKKCLGLEASAAYQGSSFSIGGSRCSSNSLSRKHAGSFTKSATDVISNVRGGTSGTAGALSFNNNKANKKNFNAWVASLKQHPAVVDFKLTPISAVFNDITKKNNMNKAIKAYLSKFDPAKCPQKCFNSGKLTVVDDGKRCKCLCISNFGGISCELKSGAKPKVQMIG